LYTSIIHLMNYKYNAYKNNSFIISGGIIDSKSYTEIHFYNVYN
jgi:hypothetical protein